MFIVSSMKKKDLAVIAQINRECFPKDNADLNEALLWVKASWKAAPRTSCFTLTDEQGKIGGYIIWLEKGGFRKSAVLELEQIGVISSWRGKGGAKNLIRISLQVIKERLKTEGRTLKLVEVTTAADNAAQRLYKSTLGAVVVATISDLYEDEGEEIIMVARNP